MNNKYGLTLYNEIMNKYSFEIADIDNNSIDIVYDIYLWLSDKGYNVKLKELNIFKKTSIYIRVVYNNEVYNVYCIEHNLCVIRNKKKATKKLNRAMSIIGI